LGNILESTYSKLGSSVQRIIDSSIELKIDSKLISVANYLSEIVESREQNVEPIMDSLEFSAEIDMSKYPLNFDISALRRVSEMEFQKTKATEFFARAKAIDSSQGGAYSFFTPRRMKLNGGIEEDNIYPIDAKIDIRSSWNGVQGK